MAEISAQDVAALRKATGAGMMDCKQALESSDGNLDSAMDWLRAKGLGKAGKLGEREAKEGSVEALVDGNVGVIVELNCNTDFVAKGADFTGTVAALAKLIAANGDGDVSLLPFEGATVGETLLQLAAKLGENVSLGRVVRFEAGNDSVLDAYQHIQNERGTIGVLVELAGVDPANTEAQAVAHEISLHVSFAAPDYLTRDEVPEAVIERERAVIEEKSRNEGVPEAKLQGAVQGRLNAFYKDVVLLEQASVKDPKVTIAKLVEGLGSGASIRRFARVKVGED
ncbi:MAG: translation elongation factor Ts [Acidimicrobiia bacterium]